MSLWLAIGLSIVAVIAIVVVGAFLGWIDSDETAVGGLIISCSIVGAFWIGIVLYYSYRYDQRMLAECMADGHKEYQCRANAGSATIIPMPVIIPGGRR